MEKMLEQCYLRCLRTLVSQLMSARKYTVSVINHIQQIYRIHLKHIKMMHVWLYQKEQRVCDQSVLDRCCAVHCRTQSQLTQRSSMQTWWTGVWQDYRQYTQRRHRRRRHLHYHYHYHCHHQLHLLTTTWREMTQGRRHHPPSAADNTDTTTAS